MWMFLLPAVQVKLRGELSWFFLMKTLPSVSGLVGLHSTVSDKEHKTVTVVPEISTWSSSWEDGPTRREIIITKSFWQASLPTLDSTTTVFSAHSLILLNHVNSLCMHFLHAHLLLVFTLISLQYQAVSKYHHRMFGFMLESVHTPLTVLFIHVFAGASKYPTLLENH